MLSSRKRSPFARVARILHWSRGLATSPSLSHILKWERRSGGSSAGRDDRKGDDQDLPSRSRPHAEVALVAYGYPAAKRGDRDAGLRAHTEDAVSRSAKRERDVRAAI